MLCVIRMEVYLLENEQNQFDLRKCLHIVLSNLWMIIFVSLTFAVAGALITKFLIPPVYQSSAMMMVNNQNQTSTNTNITSDQLRTANDLVTTYGTIIRDGGKILDQVIENLNLTDVSGMESIKAEDLRENISVTAVNDTQIMELTVRSTNKDLAQDIAVEIVNLTPAVIEELDLGEVGIVSAAKQDGQVSPSLVKNTAISFAIGFAIALLIAFLKSLLDNTISSEEDIANYVGLPILGVIPRVEEQKE